MSNVKPKTTEKQVAKFIAFKGGGAHCKVILLRHHLSGQYPSYCYVQLKDAQTASHLVDALNLKLLNYNRVWVTWVQWAEVARDPLQRASFPLKLQRTVIIKMAHHSVSTRKEDAAALIAPFGGFDQKSLRCHHIYGYGMGRITVRMHSVEAADALYDGLNGKVVGGLQMVTLRGGGSNVIFDAVDKAFHGTTTERRSAEEKTIRKSKIKRKKKKKKRVLLKDSLEELMLKRELAEFDLEVLKKMDLKIKMEEKGKPTPRKRKRKKNTIKLKHHKHHHGVSVRRTDGFKKVNYMTL